jgi:Pyridoxamine 5'-phosphate oxidase
MIDENLAEFLESGLGIHVGTRNERLEPCGCRATAVKVEDDGKHVVVYVPKAAAPQVFENLRTNGRVAVSLARPTDDRAVQVKGLMLFSWDARPEEEAFARGQWANFLGQLDAIGLPGAATSSWKTSPCVAVRLKVTAVFNQTPGPDAGGPLS